MADKHASEACARKSVGVQLSPLTQERWLSGPKRGVANPLSSNARAGSNPALSAKFFQTFDILELMDVMKKKWHRYHYKNLTYFGLSVLIGLILLKTTFFREIVFHLGNLGYIGAFFGGILFVSTFTVSIGTALLLLLAETLHPIAIGLIAGFGAVLSDLTIFHYIRNKGLGDEIKHFFEFFGSDKLRHLIHSKYFSWTLPVLGAIIIASPLPDEMGIGLMGISKLKTSQFILLSFVLNSIGIFIIVSAGAFFKP